MGYKRGITGFLLIVIACILLLGVSVHFESLSSFWFPVSKELHVYMLSNETKILVDDFRDELYDFINNEQRQENKTSQINIPTYMTIVKGNITLSSLSAGQSQRTIQHGKDTNIFEETDLSITQKRNLRNDKVISTIPSFVKVNSTPQRLNVSVGPDKDLIHSMHNSSQLLINDKDLSTNPTKDLTNEDGISTTPSCYKQVHIWSHEQRTMGKFPCPGLRCGIHQVEDTSFETMKTSDAVLLMHRTGWDWRQMHEHRPPGQKWIFFSHESQSNTRGGVIPPQEYYNNSYDYIMTFRFRESVLYGSYGRYDTSRPTVDPSDSRNWAEGKTRLAVWMASNCKSGWLKWKRTEFVQALAKIVQVDMYGGCGDRNACPHGQKAEDCQEKLRQHKFYLSLENCACRDYFTEKFWNNALLHDLVPVVFGAPRSDYEAVAPPNSFIHVRDFSSIRELADYLTMLDKNDTLYNQYFEWKKHGFVTMTREYWLLEPPQMCQIVKQLLADEDAVARGTYKPPQMPDWKLWWTNSCEHIPDFPITV